MKLYILTDYKDYFGSKHHAAPYRSGFDKELLSNCFKQYGYETVYLNFSEIDFSKDWKEKLVLYTSSEELDTNYKSYIEDIILGLFHKKAIVLPAFEFLRSNNNKVFMEIYRSIVFDDGLSGLVSQQFGTFEELYRLKHKIEYPCILKKAWGAQSHGVFLLRNEQQMLKIARKITSHFRLKYSFKDMFRPFKHKGYICNSFHADKFIVQKFIPNLKNDWKVYVFYDKIFVFKRPLLHGRFWASGGGYSNYQYGEDAEIPDGFLNYVYSVYKKLNLPNVSLDIAYDCKRFYVLEFQGIYFGTAGVLHSRSYYEKQGNAWLVVKNDMSEEKVFAYSICRFADDLF